MKCFWCRNEFEEGVVIKGMPFCNHVCAIDSERAEDKRKDIWEGLISDQARYHPLSESG